MNVNGRPVATTRNAEGPNRVSRLRRGHGVLCTVLLAIVVAITSACSASTGEAGAPKITTLKIAINSAPNSLNPALAQGSRQFIGIALSLTYDALFHQTPTGKIEPQLATKWG